MKIDSDTGITNEMPSRADGVLIFQLFRSEDRKSLKVSINSYDRFNENKPLPLWEMKACAHSLNEEISKLTASPPQEQIDEGKLTLLH